MNKLKLEDQVVSLKLAKKLKELGVKQESLYVWVDKFPVFNDKERIVSIREYKDRLATSLLSEEARKLVKTYSAFTVAELGEKLPDYTKELGNLEISKCETDHITMKPNRNGKKWWNISYWTWENKYISKNKDIYLSQKSNHLQQADTESNARAKMLVYLIENKLIKL